MSARELFATVAGFLAAAAVPAVVATMMAHLENQADVVSLWKLTLFFFYYSALATTVLGVPTFLVLRRFRLVNFWSTIFAGFVIGAIVGVLVRIPSPPQLHATLVMGLTGCGAALVFSLITRLGRNPDEARLPPAP